MRLTVSICLCLYLASPCVPAAGGGEAGRYMTTSDFLESAFPANEVTGKTLWVQGDVRQSIESVLGHRFGTLRVRYWYDGTTSAWILDEIGKELPITIGVTVVDSKIGAVHILAFRESRGWEVRYPFFTDQFRRASLDADGRLDRKIDGITGATLSVAAVTRIARIALLLHDNITETS